MYEECAEPIHRTGIIPADVRDQKGRRTKAAGLDSNAKNRRTDYLGYTIEAFPNLRDGDTVMGGGKGMLLVGEIAEAARMVPALRRSMMDLR